MGSQGIIISVYTDASFDRLSGLASWACVIKYPGLAIMQASGITHHPCINPEEAELQAILNGLNYLIDNIVPAGLIIIYTDNQGAFQRLNRKLPSLQRTIHLNDVSKKIKASVPKKCELQVKKVEAHCAVDDPCIHKQMNRVVDIQARKILREKLTTINPLMKFGIWKIKKKKLDGEFISA